MTGPGSWIVVTIWPAGDMTTMSWVDGTNTLPVAGSMAGAGLSPLEPDVGSPVTTLRGATDREVVAWASAPGA